MVCEKRSRKCEENLSTFDHVAPVHFRIRRMIFR